MNTAENKNLVLAMVLMLAVWLGFSFFFPPSQKNLPATNEPAQQVSSEEAKKPAVVEQVSDVVTAQPVVAAADVPASETSVPAREIVVNTTKYRAVFSSLGARLVSFELKDYRATAAKDSPPVQMIESGPLRHSTLRTTGSEGFVLNEDASFETAAQDLVEVSTGETYTLVFRHIAANGMQYVKTFQLRGDQYIIDTGVELHNASAVPLRGTISFSLVNFWDNSAKNDSYSFTGPASLVKGEIEEVKVDDLEKGSVAYGQDVAWTSIQSKYFLSVVVPGEKALERAQVLRNGEAIENILQSPYFTLQAGERNRLDYLLYIGPKDPQLLKAAGHNLDQVVHFGFFNILAQPLFLVLTFFYGFFKNYGISIILLTVLIKILFWPLTHKSYASMKSMQKLQPEMQKLRDKFKNDKERLNKEMMELYKTHSVNPLGGCLPMLVQIPVFFALYKVLLDSIALRHAPFAFWLTDLSAKDPYYITPILMGASMFVQQKMTPTTADPMQAKIFMMMPIIFTFMFLNFPSGLVIYWLVNNLLTILQQYFIHRKSS